jgi:hypothetical protein
MLDAVFERARRWAGAAGGRRRQREPGKLRKYSSCERLES